MTLFLGLKNWSNFAVVVFFSAFLFLHDFYICYTVELPLQFFKNSGGVSKIKGNFLIIKRKLSKKIILLYARVKFAQNFGIDFSCPLLLVDLPDCIYPLFTLFRKRLQVTFLSFSETLKFN